MKKELNPHGPYKAPDEKGRGYKFKFIYSNYNECQKYKHKKSCYSKNHRPITRYIHEASYKTERLIATEEGKKQYKLRSKTVEAHNGTFKTVYQYDNIPIIGLKRVQKLMFTIVASYNLIKLNKVCVRFGTDFSIFNG